MLKGLLRFASTTFLPASVTDFLVAKEVTNYDKDIVTSKREREKQIKQAQDRDLEYQYPSQTQQQVQQRIERTTKLREELMKDPWRIIPQTPWREDKAYWQYYYLKGFKSWKQRGRLESQYYAADVPFKDVLYFPEIEKWTRRIKRWKKKIKVNVLRFGQNVGDKIRSKAIYQCPPMTQTQAYLILNIPQQEGVLPDLELIWERYETLTTKNCPTSESQGSVYLDSKVISAKDFFIEKIPGGAAFEKQKIKQSGIQQELKKIQKQEEEDENPEWMIEREEIEKQQQLEAQQFYKQFQNGDYVAPRWLHYRYWKVKEKDIKYKIEQKQLLMEQRKALIERKRRQKQIRLEIQELQDKVDKIKQEGGDPSGIVFPQLPPEQPSKVDLKVDESIETLQQQLEKVRAQIRERFAEEYAIDPKLSMFESDSSIDDDESQFEVKVEYDYNDQLQKKQIIIDKK